MVLPRNRSETLALDRAHLWAPYTPVGDRVAQPPLVITSTEGAWLTDADGRRYLDGNASWWVSGLGHRHPRLCRVLREQTESLLHCSLAGITHPWAAALAAELTAIAPAGLSRAFFSDDGSTAVETALKMAVQYWQLNGRPDRTQIVTLDGGYHGDTVGAMSVAGLDSFRIHFAPLLFGTLRSPEPDSDGSWDAVGDWFERTLARDTDRIAAVIVEPMVQGAAGMRLWPAPLLARIRELTRRIDTFLICDEVFTGLGRTGTMWACDHARVAPDLMCLAKTLSGGVLPFAATLATERIYEGFSGDRSRALLHGHSYAGNPLGAAIALEVLAIFRDERVLEGIAERADRIQHAFEALRSVRGIRAVRTLGMIGAADLGTGGYFGELGWRFCREALTRGAYLRPLGDTIYITPPLNLHLADLDHLLATVRDAAVQVAR